MPATSSLLEYSSILELPVIGMEAEFELLVDGVVTTPESLWRNPSEFIDAPLMRRSNRSVQLPTGGALYFDSGVLEVVTPVIEIAPRCTTRMVRSLWEQIEYLHTHLNRWGTSQGKKVSLRGFSSHFNVSFEIPRADRDADRTIQKLAALLAHIITVPLIVTGTNRRSTGIGVRPRRERLEITLDFTPDASLMLATAALVVGITREVIQWPSYMLSFLEELPIQLLDEVNPGKHTTRKGWLTKDYHFPVSPFTADVDLRNWKTRKGEMKSLREISFETAWFFRDSIRRHSDPYSSRLLFAILRGSLPSLLDLPDRPAAYGDIGGSAKWGSVIADLAAYRMPSTSDMAPDTPMEEHIRLRGETRARYLAGESEGEGGELTKKEEDAWLEEEEEESRRATDRLDPVLPPWSIDEQERRKLASPPLARERRARQRRTAAFGDRGLTRSVYEEVFRRSASGWTFIVGEQRYLPRAIKGWYHVELEGAEGKMITLSIDRLSSEDGAWLPPSTKE